MYFPYLFGRAAELDALAAASGDFGSPQQIVPVIEPALKPDGVLDNYVRKLTKTLTALQRNGAVAYVVVNPHLGKFVATAVVSRWATDMAGPLGDPTMIRPAFKITAATTSNDLGGFLTAYAGRDLGIVVEDERAISAAQIATTVGSANVHMFLLPGVDSGAFVTAFGANRVVRVMDNFNAQQRNADYSGTELLADNHLAFPTTSPGGFADFTILSSSVSFSGGRTGAAVIHLTYQVAGGEFWVEHFVSDETDVAQGTFQSKLLEALDYMDAEIAADPNKFELSPAVANYQGQNVSGRSTSQGKNKQLQVEHHLFVVARHLGI